MAMKPTEDQIAFVSNWLEGKPFVESSENGAGYIVSVDDIAEMLSYRENQLLRKFENVEREIEHVEAHNNELRLQLEFEQYQHCFQYLPKSMISVLQDATDARALIRDGKDGSEELAAIEARLREQFHEGHPVILGLGTEKRFMKLREVMSERGKPITQRRTFPSVESIPYVKGMTFVVGSGDTARLTEHGTPVVDDVDSPTAQKKEGNL